MPEGLTRAGWERQAERLRKDVLDRVVFRGAAASWRDAKTRVEWLGTIAGGPGYRIKKVRYEALPGLWVPALLYEPEKLAGKVPVHLAVNGHDANGKAADYKQVRCINLAKRGMLVLYDEWFGMGQLRGESFAHYRMNQLDLCGTSGVAPFYLSMARGLDLLLSLPNADPARVAVSGLSGGGWQTIFISSLDPRVTLSNPVAGYSSFRTRVRHLKDLGDSEQTPCDLATVADYTHLTALRAPRPTLLTFNSKDNCCFESGYALPPLLDAAAPVFKLFGKQKALRSHVNDDPGTHNYEKDNRQAFYRMVGDFFYPDDKSYQSDEIPCKDEVKTKEDLFVELPDKNANFNTLALALAKDLPRDAALPAAAAAARSWQQAGREKLRQVVHAKEYSAAATQAGSTEKDGVKAVFRKLKLGDAWTVPVVELTAGAVKGTAILINDAGRKADPVNAERLLKAGYRVLAVDPFYFGESKIEQRDFLFALLVAAVGDRPLGLQASQLAALARWSAAEHKTDAVTVVAVGPRTSAVALVAAALEPKAIGGLELHGAWGSLKEVIEKNRAVDQMPEMFCFGLLEAFDVKQLSALAAPRPVKFVEAGERARKELEGLKVWYALLGRDFDPVAAGK
jgi:dienelactone hydrolase